ncbi:Ankyrin-1 [Dactylellina cionopaga]|nr:Ankyrin-1 [Dactylellina cionopaga]
MADPLSIAASVAGLISLAEVIIAKSYRYIKTVKGAPEQWQKLSLETSNLHSILLALKDKLASQVENKETIDGGDPPPNAGCGVQLGMIHATANTLSKIQNDIQGWEKSSMGKRLKWPFKVKDTQEYLAEIERHKTSFILALNINDSTTTEQILEYNKQIKQDLDRVDAERKQKQLEKHAKEKVKLHEDIVRWLSNIDAETSLEKRDNLRQEGTGGWLLNSNILKDFWNEKERCVWLHGKAGSGKSILSSAVIKETLVHAASNANDDIGVAYVFCDFNDHKTLDPANIFGSVLRQLFLSLSGTEIPHSLGLAYDQHSGKSGTPRKADVLTLGKLILDVSKEFRHAFILIDGMDECPAEIRQEELLPRLKALLRYDNNTINETATNISLFLASRPEPDIKRQLEGIASIDASSLSVKDDIITYIKAEIQRVPRLKKLGSEMQQEVLRQLSTKADGMFRWVSCQLDVLGKARTITAVKKGLEQLPKGIFETYDRILQSIDESDAESARRILTWLCLSQEPLTLQQLAEAIAIEEGTETWEQLEENLLTDLEDLFEICSSLISTQEVHHEGASMIAAGLAHFSVQEYLQSEYVRLNLAFFWIKPEQGHDYLASSCLTYLTLEEFQPPKLFRIKPTSRNFVFFWYASSGWAVHYRLGSRKAMGSWYNKFIDILDLCQFPYEEVEVEISDQDEDEDEDEDLESPYLSESEPIESERRQSIDRGSKRMIKRDKNASTCMADSFFFASGEFRALSAIEYTTMRGALGIVEHLLSSPMLSENALECTKALKQACSNGDHEMVRLLISNSKASPELDNHGRVDESYLAQLHPPEPYNSARNLAPALTLATRRGSYETVKCLLEAGADPNIRPYRLKRGYTPLYVAVYNCYSEITSLLLDNGAIIDSLCENPNLITERSWDGTKASKALETPLRNAVLNSNVKLVALLINRGANIHYRSKSEAGRSLLHEAAQIGNIEVIKLLIAGGVDVNDGAEQKCGTPIIDSLSCGSFKVARYFLSRNAELFSISKGGPHAKALAYAAYWGNIEFINLILGKGFDLSTDFAAGSIAITTAAKNEYIDVVKVLLNHGFTLSPNILHIIIGDLWTEEEKGGDCDLITTLLDLGADIHHKAVHKEFISKEHITPLEAAALQGNSRCMRILIARGANPSDGDPIYWAKRRYGLKTKERSEENVQLLLEHGAVASLESLRPDYSHLIDFDMVFDTSI